MKILKDRSRGVNSLELLIFQHEYVYLHRSSYSANDVYWHYIDFNCYFINIRTGLCTFENKRSTMLGAQTLTYLLKLHLDELIPNHNCNFAGIETSIRLLIQLIKSFVIYSYFWGSIPPWWVPYARRPITILQPLTTQLNSPSRVQIHMYWNLN